MPADRDAIRKGLAEPTDVPWPLPHEFAPLDPTGIDLEPTSQACRNCGISNEGDMLAVENQCPTRLVAQLGLTLGARARDRVDLAALLDDLDAAEKAHADTLSAHYAVVGERDQLRALLAEAKFYVLCGGSLDIYNRIDAALAAPEKP